MNNYESMLIGVGVGSAIGAGTSWYLTKRKYIRREEEVIQSVKDSYDRQEFTILKKEQQNKEAKEKATQAINKPDVSSFRMNITEKKEESVPEEIKIDEPDQGDGIEIITASEYQDPEGQYAEYEKISMNYWTNGILTEQLNGKRVDISETVGYDSLDHFDNEDVVYVRNRRLRIDYDIQKVDEIYTE